MNKKIVAGGAAVALALGLGVASVGVTNAYFSDTNSGGYVSADLGSIRVDVDGDRTGTPVIAFEGLLPGDTATGGFTVTNTGQSTSDVYMAFPSQLQLAIINDLGTYAELEITVDGEQVFFSDNLNDNYPGDPSVTPLPSQLLLAADVAPGQELDVQVSLKLAEWAETQFPGTMKLDYNIVATQPGIAPGA